MSAQQSIVVCAALAAVASLGSACNDVSGEARPEPRPVRVMEARMPEAENGARYAVSIQPYEQIPLSFKASGYVDQVMRRPGADGRPRLVQAGDAVKAGATLARVREADFRERISQAASSLREAEIGLAKAKLDVDRAQYLFAAAALTKPERDAAQAAYDQAEARIIAGRASLSLAEIAMRESALVAPSSGVILERKVELGALVNPGSVGFVLGDVSAVKAVFGVPDSTVHRITLGQSLTVTTEAFHGSRFEGKVTSVAPSADSQTRVFDIEVTIPNADGRLRPGMIGSVEVQTAAASVVNVAIPLSAVVRSAKSPSQYSVYVVEGSGDSSTARVRDVELGGVQGNLVAIASGLTAGERVVVMGAGLLADGETVRVIP